MAKRRAQQEFVGEGFGRATDSFGGASLKGNPKGKRPLDSKFPIHLTLRATKSVLRLPKNFRLVEALVSSVARKHGVKIYKWANAGNHLHLVIKILHVRRWAAFIRELTGRLGLALRSSLAGKKLWLFRPHTRIVRGWKEAFGTVKKYVELNILEGENLISRWDGKRTKAGRPSG